MTAARARVDSRVPPDILLGTKRKGAVLKSWAKTRTDRRGKAMAADPARHCRFLLFLHPSYGDRPVGLIKVVAPGHGNGVSGSGRPVDRASLCA